MSNKIEKYIRLGGFRITHAYYTSSACPLDMLWSAEFVSIAKKMGLFLYKSEANFWCFCMSDTDLLKHRAELISEESIILKLDLVPLQNDFYYVTTSAIKVEEIYDWGISKDALKMGVWRNVEISIKKLFDLENSSICYQIDSIEKYWEYLIICKRKIPPYDIVLSEESKQLNFHSQEIVSLPDGRNAYRFLSKERICLSQEKKYKIQLHEVRDKGNRLISDYIANPLYDQASVFSPTNTLSSYIYIY